MYNFQTAILVEKGYDFNGVFANEQAQLTKLQGFQFNLPEVVGFLKSQSKNFTVETPMNIEVDKSIYSIVNSYHTQMGIANPFVDEVVIPATPPEPAPMPEPEPIIVAPVVEAPKPFVRPARPVSRPIIVAEPAIVIDARKQIADIESFIEMEDDKKLIARAKKEIEDIQSFIDMELEEVTMANGGSVSEIVEGKEYPHSGGIAKVEKIYKDKEGREVVDYVFHSKDVSNVKETQTLNGFKNTINKYAQGGAVGSPKISFMKEFGEDGTVYDQTVKIDKATFEKLKDAVSSEIASGKPRKSEYVYTSGYEMYLKPLVIKNGIVELNHTQTRFVNLFLKLKLKDRNTRLKVVDKYEDGGGVDEDESEKLYLVKYITKDGKVHEHTLMLLEGMVGKESEVKEVLTDFTYDGKDKVMKILSIKRMDNVMEGVYANGGGVDEIKTYKINNTTAIEDKVNEYLHSLKLKDGYSNSMGTFTAKLTLKQFNKLVALIISYDKNDNVYILNSVNDVVYDSKEARRKRKEMFDKYANGGGVDGNDRMYNFLKDDLEKLEKAVSEGDKEETDRFFSYWGYHLKSLKNKGFSKDHERMYNFMEDDLVKLEKAISENDKEETDRFFSYWTGDYGHLKSLKYANGGGVGREKNEIKQEAEGRIKHAWSWFIKEEGLEPSDIEVDVVKALALEDVKINHDSNDIYVGAMGWSQSDVEKLKSIIQNMPKEEVEEFKFNDVKFAQGGHVSKGELVWKKLRSSERADFLYKNFTPLITPRGQELLVGKEFRFLPKNVKIKIEAEYANVEEYADGGGVSNESFEVATFDDINDSNTETVEGGLSYEDAEKLANKIWSSGKYFGVEIIDSDPNNAEPIVWIKSKNSDKLSKGGSVSEDSNLKITSPDSLDKIAEYMTKAVKKHRWDLKDLIYYFEKDNNFDYKVRVKVWDDMNVYEMRKTHDNILKLLQAIVKGNEELIGSGEYAKGGAVKKRSLMSMANLVVADWRGEKIRDWYMKNYPTDELGQELNDITFEDLWNSTNSDNIYDVIGVGDSVIRERLFEHLSEIYGVSYDYVYDKLLSSGQYAQGGAVGSPKISFMKEFGEDGTVYDQTVKIDKATFEKLKDAVASEIALGKPRKSEYVYTSGYEMYLKPLVIKNGIVELNHTQTRFVNLFLKLELKDRNTRLKVVDKYEEGGGVDDENEYDEKDFNEFYTKHRFDEAGVTWDGNVDVFVDGNWKQANVVDLEHIASLDGETGMFPNYHYYDWAYNYELLKEGNGLATNSDGSFIFSSKEESEKAFTHRVTKIRKANQFAQGGAVGEKLFKRKDTKFSFIGKDNEVHGLNYRLVGIKENGEKETISEHTTQSGAEKKVKQWLKTSPKYKGWEINAFKFKDGGAVDSDVAEFIRGYKAAILFTGNDDEGDSLDSNYSIHDFDKKSDDIITKMAKQYIADNKKAIEESGLSYEQVGMDVWYTQAGHGVGFFDRGISDELVKKLEAGAKKFAKNSPDVFAQDGKVYVEGGIKFAKGGAIEEELIFNQSGEIKFVGEKKPVSFDSGDTLTVKVNNSTEDTISFTVKGSLSDDYYGMEAKGVAKSLFVNDKFANGGGVDSIYSANIEKQLGYKNWIFKLKNTKSYDTQLDFSIEYGLNLISQSKKSKYDKAGNSNEYFYQVYHPSKSKFDVDSVYDKITLHINLNYMEFDHNILDKKNFKRDTLEVLQIIKKIIDGQKSKKFATGGGLDDRKWSEIHSDFEDEDGTIFIDAWTTGDDNEEGRVIAKVDTAGNVSYMDESARTDSFAQEVIQEVVSERSKMKSGGAITFPPRSQDGYFAKDKDGNEFQFSWSADNKLFINKDGEPVEVDEKDYEIFEK